MKVCITGATGFIGANLTRHMAEQKHDVVVLVRATSAAHDGAGKNVRQVVGDVRDVDSLRAAFQDCDVVIHLAALFNAPEASRQEYVDVNVTGTQNVLDAASHCGVGRVVHCSTVGVASGGNPPYAEDAPYDPPEWDKYETTKCEGEKTAIAFHKTNDYPVVIIRPAQVYGPGDLGKVKFYKMVKKGVIVSQGKTLKHLIYIDDLCRAFEMACTSTEGFGIPIIVASPEPTRLSDLVKIVGKELGVGQPKINLPALPMTLLATVVEVVFNAVGKKPPIFRRSMNFFTKSVAFEASNAERFLGFKSNTTTEQGVAATAKWYLDNGKL